LTGIPVTRIHPVYKHIIHAHIKYQIINNLISHIDGMYNHTHIKHSYTTYLHTIIYIYTMFSRFDNTAVAKSLDQLRRRHLKISSTPNFSGGTRRTLFRTNFLSLQTALSNTRTKHIQLNIYIMCIEVSVYNVHR